jgi:hypothetical protein
MVKYYEIEVTGNAPLLMNRFCIEEHGEGSTKRKKKVYDSKEDAEKACYRTKKGELYLPGEWFYAALVKAAVKQKYEGKKTFKDIFKAGMVIQEEEITNFTPQEYEIDSRAVVIQRARVVKSRPRFENWKATFTVQIIHDDLIDKQVLKECLDDAGFNGVGDYRPRFGRFMVTSFKEVGKAE